MTLQGWIYVANKEYDDYETVINALRALEDRLEVSLEADLIAGFSVVALVEPGDFEEYDVNPYVVERVTGGRLPTLRLNITYDLDIHQVERPEILEQLTVDDMVRVYPPP